MSMEVTNAVLVRTNEFSETEKISSIWHKTDKFKRTRPPQIRVHNPPLTLEKRPPDFGGSESGLPAGYGGFFGLGRFYSPHVIDGGDIPVTVRCESKMAAVFAYIPRLATLTRFACWIREVITSKNDAMPPRI